jgi:hypothetical protein
LSKLQKRIDSAVHGAKNQSLIPVLLSRDTGNCKKMLLLFLF